MAALIALIVERVLGYPAWLHKWIKHPVQWMGALIAWSDKSVNSPDENATVRRTAGLATIVLLIAATFLITGAIALILRNQTLGWVIEGALASSLLAGKQLADVVRAVADGLEKSLADGRKEISGLVGRDTRSLDEAGVSRAAIETLAENASDGFVAPLLALALFGLPGIAVYKAINTADSMIGHKNAKYAEFGWAAAKLDDLVNWIPARLTALLFAAAARFTSGASSSGAWQTAKTDAKKHESPNAGWPEAAMAGALGFVLGGPRTYGGRMLDLPWFGTGKSDLGPADIRAALRLYERSMLLIAALTGVVAIAFAAARFMGY